LFLKPYHSEVAPKLPGNIHTHPKKGQREWSPKRQFFFKESIDLNWIFQRDGGFKPSQQALLLIKFY